MAHNRYISFEKGIVSFHFPYDPELITVVRALPGRKWNAGRKLWQAPVGALEEAWKVLEPHGFELTQEAYKEFFLRFASREAAGIVKCSHIPIDVPGLMDGLYDYQQRGAHWLEARMTALLGDEMGLGKTVQAIKAVSLLPARRTSDIGRAILVLCPKSCMYQWNDEIARWYSQAHTGNNAVIEQGDVENTPGWHIANYEKLLRRKVAEHWDVIICDEATRIVNPRAKTVKALKQLQAPYKFALTGTPVSNTPEDLYGIIDWLDPGVLGSVFQFRSRYCELGYWGEVKGYYRLPELKAKAEPYMLRRTKSEVLKELPEKTVVDMPFDLSEKEKKLYKRVKLDIIEELQLDVDISKVSAATLSMALVKMTRLKQVADHCGLIGDNQWSTKLEVLKELLESMKTCQEGGCAKLEKVVIFTQFAEMAKILNLELSPYKPVMLIGEMDSEERERALQKFKEDAECRIFITTSAGAYGLNLQVAHFAIMYDMPWSLAKAQQQEDRIHRIGQEKAVTIYRLIARKTIDEYVLKIITRKAAVADALLGAVEISPSDVQELLL